MAAMAINNKYIEKSSSPEPEGMISKLGMKHKGEELYKVCINHSLGHVTWGIYTNLRSPFLKFLRMLHMKFGFD